MRIKSEFLRALEPSFELLRLEESHHTVFGLTPELRIAYYNPAWLEYAASNGGSRVARDWPLGRAVLGAVPPVLRNYYVAGYASAMATGAPWCMEYPAPTPHRHRTYLMRVDPLGARAGLLVTNLPVRDEPYLDEGRHADERRYRRADGRLQQCACCRTFAPRFIEEEPLVWERVPSWLAVPPPRVVASICPSCSVLLECPVALAA